MHYPKLDVADTDLGPLELVVGPGNICQPLFGHLPDQPSVERAARRLALERCISEGLGGAESAPEMSQLLKQLLRSTDPDVLETLLAEYPDLKRALFNWRTDSEIPAVLKSRAAKQTLTIAKDALARGADFFTRKGHQSFITSEPMRPDGARDSAYVQYTVRVAFGEVIRPEMHSKGSLVQEMSDRLDRALSAEMGNKDLENVSARVDDPEGATGRLETTITLPRHGIRTVAGGQTVTTQCIVTAESGFRELLERALGPDVKILMSGGR